MTDRTAIPILFITYNRFEYTKKALEALCKTKWPIIIHIWDNGSNKDMQEWLIHNYLDHPYVGSVIINEKNVGINTAFNWFIKLNKFFDYVAKVDNDTIVEENWLDALMYALEQRKELDAAGAFMQRPPGNVGGRPWTFQRWVDESMQKDFLEDNSYLAYNDYTGGTGVLIKTEVFRTHGLLFDKYKCNLGDWTLFQRMIFNGKNIAWYSGTGVNLLNIKIDGKELTNDYPEYDKELQKVRDEGNKWYVQMGAVQGLKRWIEEQGGRERL